MENLIIIEIKTCEEIIEAHQAQLTNYLRATTIEVGLLLNFGRNPQIKREEYLIIAENYFKAIFIIGK